MTNSDWYRLVDGGIWENGTAHVDIFRFPVLRETPKGVWGESLRLTDGREDAFRFELA